MTSRKQYLPKSCQFRVDESKLLDYLLNAAHPQGKSKAKFFKSRGFKRTEWEALQAALVQHGQSRPIVASTTTRYGTKYVVECELKTPDGQNSCIQAVWVAEQPNELRLVTAYPAA